MGIPPLTAVATAAVREASDGDDFRDEVLRETGINIWVIDGREEARLSAQGVLLGWPGAYGLVCDIGGSSMELADLADGRVGRRVTSRSDRSSCARSKAAAKPSKPTSRNHAEPARRNGRATKRLFLVGGSWRAIARIDMERRSYPLTCCTNTA